MKIIIKKVTGSTENKGVYQHKEYTIISRGSEKTLVNDQIGYRDHSNWYKATDSKGNIFTIWNVHNDWSTIGLQKKIKP